MKIVETEDEIILRDIPATFWTQGFLSLLGGFLFGAAVVITPNGKLVGQPGIWQIVSLAIAAFFFYWAYLKFSVPIRTTRIDVPARTIDVNIRKFLIFAKTEQFHFTQIKRAEMVRRKPDRAFLYFSVLRLADDSQIDLESSGNLSETDGRIPLIINGLLKNGKSQSRSKNRKNNSKDESAAEMR